MFLLEKKHPIEIDIIVDILKSERIPYKLRAIRQESYFCPSKTLGYDIEIYSDLEHFDYAKILIQKRISDIGKLEIAFDKPSVDRAGNPILTINKDATIHFQTIGQLEIKEYKPKKSLLKRIIDWIKNVNTN